LNPHTADRPLYPATKWSVKKKKMLRPMSHLRFCRAILSCNLIARQFCNMQLCMSHTVTLSHKQELTNQRQRQSCKEYSTFLFRKGVARLLQSCGDKIAGVTSVIKQHIHIDTTDSSIADWCRLELVNLRRSMNCCRQDVGLRK